MGDVVKQSHRSTMILDPILSINVPCFFSCSSLLKYTAYLAWCWGQNFETLLCSALFSFCFFALCLPEQSAKRKALVYMGTSAAYIPHLMCFFKTILRSTYTNIFLEPGSVPRGGQPLALNTLHTRTCFL